MQTTDTSTLDKVVGVIIIVLSLCGAWITGLVGLGGLEELGAGTRGGVSTATAIGGVTFIIGAIRLLITLIIIACGVGVVLSQRWGFLLVAVFCGIDALIGLMSIAKGGIFSLFIYAGFCAFCFMRLTGKIGEPPV